MCVCVHCAHSSYRHNFPSSQISPSAGCWRLAPTCPVQNDEVLGTFNTQTTSAQTHDTNVKPYLERPDDLTARPTRERPRTWREAEWRSRSGDPPHRPTPLSSAGGAAPTAAPAPAPGPAPSPRSASLAAPSRGPVVRPAAKPKGGEGATRARAAWAIHLTPSPTSASCL